MLVTSSPLCWVFISFAAKILHWQDTPILLTSHIYLYRLMYTYPLWLCGFPIHSTKFHPLERFVSVFNRLEYVVAHWLAGLWQRSDRCGGATLGKTKPVLSCCWTWVICRIGQVPALTDVHSETNFDPIEVFGYIFLISSNIMWQVEKWKSRAERHHVRKETNIAQKRK